MKPLSQGVRTSGAPMCVCAAGLVVRIRTSIRRRPPSRAFSRSNSNEYSQAATLARFLSFEFERHFAGSYRRSLSLVRIRTTLRRQLPSLAFSRSNSNDTSCSYRRSFSAVRSRTTLRRQLPSLAFCRSNSNDTSRAATVARFLPFEFERHFAGSCRRVRSNFYDILRRTRLATLENQFWREG